MHNIVAPIILFKTNITFSYGCKYENYMEKNKPNVKVPVIVNECFHTQK